MILTNQNNIISIQWEKQQKTCSFDVKKVEQSIDAILHDFGLQNKEASIILVEERKMKALNKRYRGIDESTDVLAFPVDMDYHDKRFLGDIFICCEIAGRQAKSYCHCLDEEINILVLHGILHLLGYDHLTDRGEMARIENKLRNYL
ncbi:MAG: rRNA maturation RNase YbeY [Candidatus Fischerbacteria bacterium RBG_13_37_8]|uniref:Endoribonuclease YbeY n=1 Tax=Candidatus Fischerbacteria bacterium RBG_13_37_8 TaxID=1817863 RepID=A0A1F5VRD8_9BACT|nr:MAG: rRNA maturation RNase YbeY [Candidatus Fischerbacteria bacterium RBG_13_37_8]